MTSYLLRRLASVVPLWLVVSFVAFLLATLAPGDPALAVLRRESEAPPTAQDIARVHHQLHLDDPFLVRYARWVSAAVRGDLGRSFRDEAVASTLADRLFVTLQLAVPALLLSLLLGISAGVLSAATRGSPVDQSVRLGALLGASMPSFWLGYVLIIVFAVRLHLLPATGRGGWRHLVLPVVTLSLAAAASLARLTRSSLLEALGDDYVRTARAKGLRERTVVASHALRNSMLPIVTVAGLRFGHLLAGAAVVETVFTWPGIGTYVLNGVNDHDYPVIQGFVLLTGTLFLLLNALVDVLYVSLDPRVGLSSRLR